MSAASAHPTPTESLLDQARDLTVQIRFHFLPLIADGAAETALDDLTARIEQEVPAGGGIQGVPHIRAWVTIFAQHARRAWLQDVTPTTAEPTPLQIVQIYNSVREVSADSRHEHAGITGQTETFGVTAAELSALVNDYEQRLLRPPSPKGQRRDPGTSELSVSACSPFDAIKLGIASFFAEEDQDQNIALLHAWTGLYTRYFESDTSAEEFEVFRTLADTSSFSEEDIVQLFDQAPGDLGASLGRLAESGYLLLCDDGPPTEYVLNPILRFNFLLDRESQPRGLSDSLAELAAFVG